MRQVDRDELIYAIINGMRDLSPTWWKQLLDPRREQRDQARAILAGAIADKLARFEVLSDTPLAHPMGSETFARPVRRMLGDAAPALDEQDATS